MRTMSTGTPAVGFTGADLVGGRLALDFVNTVAWRGRPTPEDRLDSYARLVRWSEVSGAISPSASIRLLRGSRRSPARAALALARAKELRESLHRLFSVRARRERTRPRDLERLNEELSRAPRARLVSESGAVSWKHEEAFELDSMLASIAWSAAEILVSGAAGRVKRCAGEGCGWLFLDESRGASRRWCSMSDCGNRAKARRHYRRHEKKTRTGGAR